MSCYDQGAVEVSATNFVQSLHYTFGQTSLIVTISLSAIENFAGPGFAAAYFIAVKQVGLPVEQFPTDGGIFVGPAQIRKDDLTDVFGVLWTANCGAKAVVNFFAWPRVNNISADPSTHTAQSPRRERVLDVAQQMVVTLYEPHSGYVKHRHLVTMFAGGRVVSEEEAIETANKEALRFGHLAAELKMKVSSDYEYIRHCNRIDLNTGEFVRPA
ncbi:hypothetical protein EDE15_1793 [Edaphobacter aggregans]|uniref:Uncharacterized protein n=1 Tax=Edaphobacter aggregans TaxID=570835 RepID=A0A3R9NXU0_9BACT|nr:hypothetical protein [Edaphobacter aggregans]RSL16282.1 hypothetical protein EDE15_1793 [Edaphobacter aggregans]